MLVRDAFDGEPYPEDWDLSYEPCPCGDTAGRFDRATKAFYQVPCEGAIGGSRLSWPCKMGHMHSEFEAGRDPVGKGGTPFRTSAAEGWTQLGHAKENADAAKAAGKDLQLASRG